MKHEKYEARAVHDRGLILMESMARHFARRVDEVRCRDLERDKLQQRAFYQVKAVIG